LGVANVIKAYNLTPTQQIVSQALSQSALSIAVYITYILIPISLLVFSIGIFWLALGKQNRWTAVIVVVSAIFYLGLAILLETNFTFNYSIYNYYLTYLGIGAVLVSGGLVMINERPRSRGIRASPVMINPETPYSNIKMLSSKIFGKMSGDIKILDMHFDSTGIDNLIRMVNGNETRYRSILILTKRERLTKNFDRSFKDFRTELEKYGVAFDVRVLPDELAAEQHERIIMDDRIAYKIPPLNIINKKYENIVGINRQEAERRFMTLQAHATKYENLPE
jgi:hypothetical protein